MLNLIIGISNYQDFKLYQNSYSSFYLGYTPAFWQQKYPSQISPNRRYRKKEQISNLSEIEKICQEKKTSQIYVAVNTPFINKINIDDIKKIIHDLLLIDIDGIIIGSITLAKYLNKIAYKKIILSGLFGIYTQSALDFLLNEIKDIKMVILPREISDTVAITFAQNNKNIDFEFFLFGDNCIYCESNCFSEHGYDDTLPECLCKYCISSGKFYKRADYTYKSKFIEKSIIEPRKELTFKKELQPDFSNFHNFDVDTIKRRIELFMEYKNIKGLKIASRGRNLGNYIRETGKILNEIISKS